MTNICGTLNINGKAQLENDATLVSSLNDSGNSNFNNVNVSGSTYYYGHLFAQQYIYGQNSIPSYHSSYDSLVLNKSLKLNTRGNGNINFNVSGTSKIIINYNDFSLLSSLTVSGFTTLNNNSTLISSLNVSGNYTLNNTATLLSSLNVSGRTIFGNDI